jgi:hypothetical protein
MIIFNENNSMKRLLQHITLIVLGGVILMSIVISCSSSKNQSDERYMESFKLHPSFYQSDYTGYDSDSTWKLSIRFGEEVVFTSKTDNIIFRGKADAEIVAQGSDIVKLRATNDDAQLIISIDVQSCNETGYVVDVTYIPNKSKQEIAYTGCGQYNGDARLYDIWVLIGINDDQLDDAVFRRQLPFLEINLRDMRMTGFGGCNEFMADLRFSYNKIIPSPIAATKKYCQEESEFEKDFFRILGSEYLVPSFKRSILVLQSTEGLLIFKKVD